MSHHFPVPKRMPTIARNSTMTEEKLPQELLAESEFGVNGMIAVCPFNDPKANVEAVAMTKQTRKRISFLTNVYEQKILLHALSQRFHSW